MSEIPSFYPSRLELPLINRFKAMTSHEIVELSDGSKLIAATRYQSTIHKNGQTKQISKVKNQNNIKNNKSNYQSNPVTFINYSIHKQQSTCSLESKSRKIISLNKFKLPSNKLSCKLQQQKHRVCLSSTFQIAKLVEIYKSLNILQPRKAIRPIYEPINLSISQRLENLPSLILNSYKFYTINESKSIDFKIVHKEDTLQSPHKNISQNPLTK